MQKQKDINDEAQITKPFTNPNPQSVKMQFTTIITFILAAALGVNASCGDNCIGGSRAAAAVNLREAAPVETAPVPVKA